MAPRRITLNRPEKLNAISPLRCCASCTRHSGTRTRTRRSTVSSSAAPVVPSAPDMTWPAHVRQPTGAVALKRGAKSFDDDTWQMERAQRLRMALFDMHKPVIAQVHGYCLAGGTDLATLCDMLICAEDARFGFPPAPRPRRPAPRRCGSTTSVPSGRSVCCSPATPSPVPRPPRSGSRSRRCRPTLEAEVEQLACPP